nr:site-specific integrase [uncultured Massilia sp.]
MDKVIKGKELRLRELRRKVLIPTFTLTEVCDKGDPAAVKRSISGSKEREAFTYHLKPVVDPIEGAHRNHNLFPIVLSRDSIPWDLGALFILDRLEAETNPDMVTLKSLADDLGAFREWLDSHENPDYLLFSFPKLPLSRVTYRYRGSLKKRIEIGEIAASTAKRRMATVVSFYRWMIKEEFFQPTNDPWQERTYGLTLTNSYGGSFKKTVKSTDLQILASKADDPLDDTIQDDDKLRPLPLEEQKWVMEAADALGNGEMYLFILFMLLTGARIQTVGTLRVRHFIQANPAFSNGIAGQGQVFKLKAGPGTGIDTKRNKNKTLQIPKLLYEALHVYVISDRARRRREMAPGGDHLDQYFFLTQQGSPYYTAKAQSSGYDPNMVRRHHKNGGTVRQFLKERLIPFVQNRYDPKFKFRIHDLRATFGINQTDIQMSLVQAGVITLSKARSIVKELMWHTSSATTDKYLDYRKQMKMILAAINGHGDHVQGWIDRAMKGIENR